MADQLLLIDDDPGFIRKFRVSFPDYRLCVALDMYNAELEISKAVTYNLIILDLNLDPESDTLEGLELIGLIKAQHPDSPLIVITADEKIETVVTAMKAGASDYLCKREFSLLSWQRRFEMHINHGKLKKRLGELESEKYPFVTQDPTVVQIKKTLALLSSEPRTSLLLTGETGTGKEVAARFFHQKGLRSDKSFVPVNLSAINETMIESALFGHKKGAFTGASESRDGFLATANGGILFLDEIGDVSLNIQIKLLRFLEDNIIYQLGDTKPQKLDVQVIAATNRDLSELIKQGVFRSDLYYRLKNFEVEIPPLRHRKKDIILITNLNLASSGYTDVSEVFTEDLIELYQSYLWPGNIRELINTTNTVLLNMRVKGLHKADLTCLPLEIRNHHSMISNQHGSTPKKAVSFMQDMVFCELDAIEEALQLANGKKTEAARSLNMNSDQLRYRVLKYHEEIDQERFPLIYNRYAKLFSNHVE